MNRIVIRLVMVVLCCSCFILARDDLNARGKTEEAALDKMAEEILENSKKFRNKKIGLFSFTSIEGKEITEGKRLSRGLLERLIGKEGLSFIERAELDKLLKAQGIEQTGIVDSESLRESGKVLPIDVMIQGMVARIDDTGELYVKIVHIQSGEIFFAKSVKFDAGKDFKHLDKQSTIKLYQKSPEKLQRINEMFFRLKRLSRQRPAVFLIITLKRKDAEELRESNPGLARRLAMVKEKIKTNRPAAWKRIVKSRRNLHLVEKNTPEKYNELVKIKRRLMKKPPR